MPRFIYVLQRVRAPHRKTSFSFLWQLPIHKTLDAQSPILHIVREEYSTLYPTIQLLFPNLSMAAGGHGKRPAAIWRPGGNHSEAKEVLWAGRVEI